jgi:site-specific DNA-methyltransferase (adenine-specific)
VYLHTVNGTGYIRQWNDGEKETVCNLGRVGDVATIYKPKLLHDKAGNLLSKLPDNSVDLIITDPPYGASMRVGRSQCNGQYEMSAKSRGRITNHGGLEFLEDIPQQLRRVLRPDSHLYVFCNHQSYPDMKAHFDEAFDMSQLLVWEKPTYGVGDSQTYSPVHEFIMHYRYGSPELRYGGDSKRPKNVIEFKRARNNNEVVAHATQKPIELMDFLIEKSSDPGDLLVDPYGGSFAAARAAQHKFRRAISTEIDVEITADGRELAQNQLHNDPVYGIDWADIGGIEVAETAMPASGAAGEADPEVKADD